MMRGVYWLWAIFVIAIKRLYAQKGLTFATLVGLVVTTALILSVPLYTDAVYFRILQEELAAVRGGSIASDLSVASAERSPFTFLFQYVGSREGPLAWEDIQGLDSYLVERAADRLDLPVQELVRQIKTPNFRLFPPARCLLCQRKESVRLGQIWLCQRYGKAGDPGGRDFSGGGLVRPR